MKSADHSPFTHPVRFSLPALSSRLGVLALALAGSVPHAAAQAPGAAASAVSAGSVLQMLLGLGLVLAMVAAGAWFLKRFQSNRGPAAGAIKVIAGAAVGPRERVVLVEVGGAWLVLGVAPGRVSALHTLPRGELPAGAARAASGEPGFAPWLKRMMEKRDAH